ncbi:MAG: DUF3352 domain-containing protein [Dehalococcoidia bacterium]
MDVLSRRSGAVALTGGLAALAVVLGWFLVSASGRAQGVELTTAELVPQDSTIYVAVNTKLDSSEWIAAFDLVEKLGLDDPESELIDAVEGGGEVDWEDDVAPFLGGNAAFYMRDYDWSGDPPEEFGVIVRAANAGRAMEVVFEQLGGGDPDEAEYEGQTYYFIPDPIDGDGYLARIGSHLVITATEAEMERVIDVAQGREPSLKDDSEFAALHDELTRNFIGFVYMDTEKLLGGALQSGLGVFVEDEDDLWQWGSSKTASVISAKDGGFVFQTAGQTEASPISPLLTARDESRFAGMVPADTAMLFSVYDVAGAWDGIIDAWGPYLDDAVAAEGEYDSYEEALDEAAAELGVENFEDFLELFDGEAALAAWFPTDDEDDGLFAFFAEVSDDARLREIIEGLDTIEVTGTETWGGVEVTLTEDEENPGEELAYTITDGYALFGDPEAVRRILEHEGDTLAGSGRYRSAKDTLGTRLGSFAYFDFPRIFTVFGGDEYVSEDELNMSALQALLFTMVEDGGFTRAAGAVTIDD